MREGVVLSEEDLKERDITLLSNGAMRMGKVLVKDGGMYKCIASSEAGNATKMINLIVQGKFLI